MAADPKLHLGLTRFTFFIISIFASSFLSLSSSDSSTVYEILSEFGLPSGLLPDSVINYTLSSDGGFVVTLEKTCYIQFDYLVYYEKTITGKLTYGSIGDLNGIQVQRFFLWLDVDEIRVDLPPSDNIYFQVGIINKKLDVEQFKTVHSCRGSVKRTCHGSWKRVIELPEPVDEMQMLITE